MIGLVGKKLGMTRIFKESGHAIPVTVIEVQKNRIAQIKSKETDGYFALQLTTGEVKASHLNKAQTGHFAKGGVKAGKGLWEFRLMNQNKDIIKNYQLNQEIGLEIFKVSQKVDVTGFSLGKGFAGAVKRHGFRTQDATHGNSLSHRAPGSIGQNQTPGKVFKGKKMAGRLGNKRVTVQNLEVIAINMKSNCLLVKGSVPGVDDSNLIIKPSIKKQFNNA